MHYLQAITAMLQNKIYKNFSIEILKTFFLILFGISLIALTVRAVNFLDLIVDSGYSISTYLYYSVLNLFGIAPKFIPLSFLLALTIFIVKHLEEGEFIILWTSGIRKIEIVKLFFYISVLITIFYLLLSSLITPFFLNKSRQILSGNQFDSFLPTVRSQHFSDSFKGFTFIVEKKIDNKIKNIFLHDTGNNLKNLSSNTKKNQKSVIVAEKGAIEEKKIFLFNGQIISSDTDNFNNDIIKFDQLSIDLSNLVTTTIKSPKLQETSTIKLLSCLDEHFYFNKELCIMAKEEIIPTLNRRIIMPLYVPIISLICCFLLLKNKKFFLNKILIFSYCFTIVLFTELTVKFTGLNFFLKYFFSIIPFLLIFIIYFLLKYNFLMENKNHE